LNLHPGTKLPEFPTRKRKHTSSTSTLKKQKTTKTKTKTKTNIVPIAIRTEPEIEIDIAPSSKSETSCATDSMTSNLVTLPTFSNFTDLDTLEKAAQQILTESSSSQSTSFLNVEAPVVSGQA